MKQGDYNGEKDGPGCEAEAIKGLAEALFTGEAFGCAAIVGAGKVWIVHVVGVVCLAFGFRGFLFVLPPVAAAGKFGILASFEHRGVVGVAEGKDVGKGG